MSGFLIEMISRLSLRNLRTTLAPAASRTGSSGPVDVATQMRAAGPTRVQD